VCTHIQIRKGMYVVRTCVGITYPCVLIYKTRARIQLYTLMDLHFLFCPLRVVAHCTRTARLGKVHIVYMYCTESRSAHSVPDKSLILSRSTLMLLRCVRKLLLIYARFGNIVFSVMYTSGKICHTRCNVLPRSVPLPGSAPFFTRVFDCMLSFLLLRTISYAYFRKAATLWVKHLRSTYEHYLSLLKVRKFVQKTN